MLPYDQAKLKYALWSHDKHFIEEYNKRVQDFWNDQKAQDAVEGRARFARPNIPRPSKAIGEYSE